MSSGQQTASKEIVQQKRLSEMSLQLCAIKKTSDSPNPKQISGNRGFLICPKLLLAKDFRKIYFDQYTQLPVMVPDLFNVMTSDAAYEKTSGAGTVPDFIEFTGKVQEVKPTQMYDKSYVFTEYAAKIEIQRKLAAELFVGCMSLN